MANQNIKVYVATTAAFDSDGRLRPTSITWENGKKYIIDKVTDVRQAAAMRAGGQGDRYTVLINGRQSYLFFERGTARTGPNIGRWFVERKVV